MSCDSLSTEIPVPVHTTVTASLKIETDWRQSAPFPSAHHPHLMENSVQPFDAPVYFNQPEPT
jgi:hypothetical protein